MEVTPEPIISNVAELFPKLQIKSVIPVKIQEKPIGVDAENWKYRFDSIVVVCVELSDETTFKMELAEVTNQPTWTPDLAGQQQCVADINAWL